jgi:hypothetical protein
MGLTRRTILKVLLGWSLAATTGAGEIRPPVPTRDRRRVLGALLDTLLPPEDGSPGASDLGIVEVMLKAARGTGFGRLIDRGCQWLDQQAGERFGGSFAEISEEQRVAVVQIAEDAPRDSLPNVFFRAVRDDLFDRYYADVRAWPSLGFAGPPQPVGFLDFDRPPAP